MAPVVDASVGLRWVLDESDSGVAAALDRLEPDLFVPDFWRPLAAGAAKALHAGRPPRLRRRPPPQTRAARQQ